MKPLGYVVIASLMVGVLYVVGHIWRDAKQRRSVWAVVGVLGLPGIVLMLHMMVRAALSY